MQTFKVRAFESMSGSNHIVTVDLETIIASPYGMHMGDVGLIALNELRRQRGLEPLSEDVLPSEHYEEYQNGNVG